MSNDNVSQPRISKRVFIVGCPRSGTTLLQGMLACHPRIKSFPETHFFRIAYPRNLLKRLITWPAFNLQGVLGKFVRDADREDLLEVAHMGLFDRKFHEPFVRVLDRLALDGSKDIWVEKTPRHLHCIEEIQNRVPGALFIHIVRHGKDVVASLYKAISQNPEKWGNGNIKTSVSIEECIERWNNDMSITEKWSKNKNHFVVRYESLTDSPATILKEICEFLCIEYSPSMEHPQDSFSGIVKGSEVWKKNNAISVKNMSGTFDEIFSDKEKAYIKKQLNVFDV